MTGKRFTYDSKTVSIFKDGEFWLDGNVDTACNHSEICNELNKLADENEQLREQIADLENSFDICKHYKETYGDEIVHIKQTIKDMMENERTELGRSVLKQLWEAIQ